LTPCEQTEDEDDDEYEDETSTNLESHIRSWETALLTVERLPLLQQ